jgi:hypothetical protein
LVDLLSFEFQETLAAMIPNYSRDIDPIKLIFSEHPSFISTSSIKFDHIKLGAFFFLHA